MPSLTPDKQPSFESLTNQQARELCNIIVSQYGKLLGCSCLEPEEIQKNPQRALTDILIFFGIHIRNLEAGGPKVADRLAALLKVAAEIRKIRNKILERKPPSP